MIIDDKSFQLPISNYLPIELPKSQIILGNTFNHDMRHYNGWLTRYGGDYKKTAAFTVNSVGVIYQHFDPKFKSNYFKNDKQNDKSIVILLENDGWLLKDYEKNRFITWIGDIYKGPSEVIIKRWRGFNYWSPYTDEQVESTIELVSFLCDKYDIPLETLSHNTKVDNIDNYEGVLYKSNLEKYYSDLTPSWDFETFKNKL